jgi:aspartate aminotransferase-like enzyme
MNEKLNTILKVLQDFGLNVIQNLGQLRKTLTQNTSQVEELAKAVIEVKALGNRLGEVLKMKNDLIAEIGELKTLVRASLQKMPATHIASGETEGVSASIASEMSPEGILQNLLIAIAQESHGEQIYEEFQKAKEQIFRITGGHKVLREINEASKNLKFKEEITDAEKEALEAKINYWIEML